MESFQYFLKNVFPHIQTSETQNVCALLQRFTVYHEYNPKTTFLHFLACFPALPGNHAWEWKTLQEKYLQRLVSGLTEKEINAQDEEGRTALLTIGVFWNSSASTGRSKKKETVPWNDLPKTSCGNKPYEQAGIQLFPANKIQLLLDAKADPFQSDKNEKTCLDYFVECQIMKDDHSIQKLILNMKEKFFSVKTIFPAVLQHLIFEYFLVVS
jgi:hypothetical protein